MPDYVSQIPVDVKYAEMIGHVLYNFAYAEWNIIYLGSLVVPSFVNREAGNDSYTIAREFQLLAQTGQFPELLIIANRFIEAENKRVEFLRSTPITGLSGAQILSDSGNAVSEQWTLDTVQAYAEELQSLGIDSDNLYHKLQVKT